MSRAAPTGGFVHWARIVCKMTDLLIALLCHPAVVLGDLFLLGWLKDNGALIYAGPRMNAL